MASENRRKSAQGTKRGEGSSRRKKFCRDSFIRVMTTAFDVSWAGLDLRQKHKISQSQAIFDVYDPTSCRTARGRENLEAAAGSLAIGWSEVRAGGRVGSGVNGATWSDRVWNPVRYDQRSAGLMSQPVCPVPRDMVSQPAASQRGRESRGLGGGYAGPRGLPPTQRQLAAENRGKLPPQPTERKLHMAESIQLGGSFFATSLVNCCACEFVILEFYSIIDY
jgi:hypothetical protein